MACLLHNVIVYWVQYPGQIAQEVEHGQFIDALIAMEFFPHLLEGVRIWTQAKERA